MLGQQTFMVADRCNLSCTYCYYETGEYQYRSSDAGVDDYDRWLAACSQLEPLRSVSFTGGEPLLRPDLLELVTMARRHTACVSLMTNAVLVTEETAAALAQVGCRADVSLDHVGSAVSDRVRGGTAATLRGIRRLAGAGVDLQIVVVVTSANWSAVDDVLHWSCGNGWRVELLPVSVPTLHPLGLSTLTEPERAAFVDVLDRWSDRLGHRLYLNRLRQLVLTGRLPSVRSCQAGQEGIFVNSDGDVWVCGHRRFPLGNILRHNPGEVLAAKERALAASAAGPCVSAGCLVLTG